MRLRAWRETWMWLAVSACATPTPKWMTTSPPQKVSIYDAAPLAGAEYVATVAQGDFGNPGPNVAIEHGRFQCGRLVELLEQSSGYGDIEKYRTEAKQTCDPEVATLLREMSGFVFVVDGGGRRWLTADQVVRAASPIDSPAKALLAVWTTGKYELSWTNGSMGFGSLEDGLVRQVAGGYEVVGGTSEEESNCGGSDGYEKVTNFRVILFVDVQGVVTVRDRVQTHHYKVADPCHPMGRRPEGFADVTSDGTVRGHLLRAMHHEAESVRAFERIARELHANGAPAELVTAARAAAEDEREHARACARLAGVDVTIACDELPARGLVDLALDNAREGCVGEAYAALANVVQARHAEHADLRAHFAAIATDELAHAALAHAIARWIDTCLSPAERALVRAATEDATRELAASLSAPTATTRALGLPTGAEALRLLAAVTGVAQW